jgi:putative RecB family exonuclease
MPLYSHSRLRLYESCPRRYRYKYLERLRLPEVKTAEMFRGSQVHAALETLYRRVVRGKAPSLDELLGGYRRRWEQEWKPEILITHTERGPEDYRRQGEADLAAYYRHYAPFDGDRTIDVETRITLPLDTSRRISLQGFVDRVSVAPDGAWQIHDYKTSRTLPGQQELDEDRQLALYQIGIQRKFPGQPPRVELVWHYLAFDIEMRSRRTAEALATLETRTLAVIDAIQSDRAFPPVVGHHCRSCSYRSLCPAWRQEFKGSSLPDQIQPDLFEFPGREDVETVFRTTQDTLALPGAGDPRPAEAEAVIKGAGRGEAVARMDDRTVRRRLAAGLQGAIQSFFSRIRSLRISLRRR